jgi:hypothetical protein
MWYLHSHFTCAKLCHSCMAFPPVDCPLRLLSGEISYNTPDWHNFFSHTGIAGGLLKPIIKPRADETAREEI